MGQSGIDNLETTDGQSRMDNPETTDGAIRNRQSRDNRWGNQEQTIQRQPMGQSGIDNLETTDGAISNGQSRDTGNIGHNTQNEYKQNKNTTRKTKKMDNTNLTINQW